MSLVEQVLGPRRARVVRDVFGAGETLNMTHLALGASDYINAVARKHGEVSQELFPEHRIFSITNGVHAATWVGAAFAELYDEFLPGWREDNYLLRNALAIPKSRIVAAHAKAKTKLLRFINRMTNAGFELEHFTLGFARRATAYKRVDLLFDDPARLVQLAERFGLIQVVFAGKAHPHDEQGKQLIRRVFEMREQLRGHLNVVFLPNYDIHMAKLLVAGVDVWLNTPERPLEASGTSGMKCALNGVPSLSILDGWWLEGCVHGVTGWAIDEPAAVDAGPGAQRDPAVERAVDAQRLYQVLTDEVIPAYAADDDRFVEIMRHAIALNGAYFNTQRMAQEYATEAYFR